MRETIRVLESLRSQSELRAGFEPVAAALAARRATPRTAVRSPVR